MCYRAIKKDHKKPVTVQDAHGNDVIPRDAETNRRKPVHIIQIWEAINVTCTFSVTIFSEDKVWLGASMLGTLTKPLCAISPAL